MLSAGEKTTVLSEATLCSLGLMGFAFFVHYKYPVRLISFTALLISALIVSRNVRLLPDLKKISGGNTPSKELFVFTLIGIFLGIALATLYRWYMDISLFPVSVHSFVVIAAIIGCMEELVFRGFIQGHVETVNGPFSVFFSSLSHTGYKCFLFLSPAITVHVNVGILAFYTFIAGLLFGLTRYLSKSLLPALAAHALFDILVYAEYLSAPWWLW